MKTTRRIPLAALLVLLGSCATPGPPPPPPAIVRAPPPRPTSAPVQASSDWRDGPVTPGDWRYAREGNATVARFGSAGAQALLVLRCDLATKQVTLLQPGVATSELTIRTSSTARTFSARPVGDAYLGVQLAGTDPILDAMGFSRGRFVVQQAGGATLVVPAWAEILRVTEDCRS